MVAQEYSLEELNNKATVFFEETDIKRLKPALSNSKMASVEILPLKTIGRNGKDYMYLINRTDSAGWVILSNEKKYISVIAYSNSGNFFYDEGTPLSLQAIIEQHMDAIDSVRLYGSKDREDGMTKQANPNYYRTDVLLGNTMWNQTGNRNGENAECDKVYNKYMPNYGCESCEKTPAGCGAIAVAQIMRYWRWPDYADVAKTSVLSVGYGKVRRWFDWDAMVDTLANDIPMYNVNAVAGLIRDAANGILTTYTCSGSAAEMNYIYTNIQDNLLYHARKTTNTDKINFDSLLRAEIDAKRPVIVQAWKGGASHTFVVDAYSIYDGEVNYGINWGWGGDRGLFCNITFGGFSTLRSCLSQVYPDCSKRQGIVSIDTAVTIFEDAARTYYSSTNINVCTSNNNVIVQQNGHLTIKAGQQIVLKPGFHAQQGSFVLLTIANPCDDAKIPGDRPSRHSLAKNAEMFDNTAEPTWETNVTGICINNRNHVIDANDDAIIDHIVLYNASGQLLQTNHGADTNLSALPSGFYVLQKHMTDGSVVSETIVKN